jgi:plasmid stabilization system protein ParE
MGRERNDWKQGLRMFTVRRYLILYREIEGGVLIERVLNAYRNIEGLLREPRAE